MRGLSSVILMKPPCTRQLFVRAIGCTSTIGCHLGLRTPPSPFSRLMVAVLNNLIPTAVLVYLDDLIILGKTPEEHADNLIRLLDVLFRHNLKINLKKMYPLSGKGGISRA